MTEDATGPGPAAIERWADRYDQAIENRCSFEVLQAWVDGYGPDLGDLGDEDAFRLDELVAWLEAWPRPGKPPAKPCDWQYPRWAQP